MDETTAKDTDSAGVGGALDLRYARDVKLIERAIRQWKIPDAILEKLPGVVSKAINESPSTRTKLHASALLVKMHAENREAAALALKAQQAPQPLAVINNNLQVVSGNSNDSLERATAIASKLRDMGILITEGETNLQPPRSDHNSGGIPDPSEDGPVS